MLPGPITMGPYLAASLIGFAAGTAISVLLLVLTVRAAKLPGTRIANALFAACSLVWNLAGLAHAIAITLGAPEQGRAALLILGCQFTGAAAWPVTVIALWSPLVSHRWQRIGCRLLQTLAALSCAAIVIPLWSGVFTATNYRSIIFLKESTAYNGAILLILGIALFRDRLMSRTMRIPSLAMLVGVFGATLADVLQQVLPFDPSLCSALRVTSEQLTLFIVLGAFFLFARFRFSDLFIRNSLRIVLAALTAVAFTLLDHALSLARFENQVAFPGAARAFVETLAAVPMLFLFTFSDRHIGECVNRWIFRARDYRALGRQLADVLAQLRDEPAIAEAVETAARNALDVNAAKLIALERLPKSDRLDGIHDGDPVELDRCDPWLSDPALRDVELLVPVRFDGRVTQVLAIAPGPARRGLVTHEVNYLRSVAAQFGHRLDTLRREERTLEAQSREAVLLQQVTEAELRALRAQINPHFLFNSLNSIANLVVANPEKAEAMTLRLARVFRHVLANSARPLILLHEEIEFLETYLQIEEARFGSRLQVTIAVDPAVAMDQIPTLILQPIVENALKHGLGPKPGQGHLWITAVAEGNQVRLRVEDDGVGPGKVVSKPTGNGRSKGVGLENVALRLNALYQDQSQLTMEMREAGGTRVTILLPRESGVPA
jgi:two-component system LytT family sensor kinase